MKARLASLVKSFGILATGMCLSFFFVWSLASDEVILKEGEYYRRYGFEMKNWGHFTVAEYGGREVAVYYPGAEKTFETPEDVTITMHSLENGAVKIGINFDLIGMLRKKMQEIFS